jgi:hypothetical protein
MHLVYFLLSIICLIAAIFAPVNTTGAMILILASIGFLFYGIWRLLNLRLGNRRDPLYSPLSPEELKAMREKAQQNKSADRSQAPDA